MSNLSDVSTAITYIGSLQKVKTMVARDKTSREFQKVAEKIQLKTIPKGHIGSISGVNTSQNTSEVSQKTEEVAKIANDETNSNTNTANNSDKPKSDGEQFSLYLNNGVKTSQSQGQIKGNNIDTKI